MISPVWADCPMVMEVAPSAMASRSAFVNSRVPAPVPTPIVVAAAPPSNKTAPVTVMLPSPPVRLISSAVMERSAKEAVLLMVPNPPQHPEGDFRLQADGRLLRGALEGTPCTYSGIGRIYREDPRAGCTGRPGFAAGTVDHAGAPRCPLHEEGLPEHLLG